MRGIETDVDENSIFSIYFRTAESFGVEKLIDPRDTRPLLTQWIADAYRLLATDLGPKGRPARP